MLRGQLQQGFARRAAREAPVAEQFAFHLPLAPVPGEEVDCALDNRQVGAGVDEHDHRHDCDGLRVERAEGERNVAFM